MTILILLELIYNVWSRYKRSYCRLKQVYKHSSGHRTVPSEVNSGVFIIGRVYNSHVIVREATVYYIVHCPSLLSLAVDKFGFIRITTFFVIFFKESKYLYFQTLYFICVCHTKIYVKYGVSSFFVSSARVHANTCISVNLNLQYRVQ